MCYVKFLLEIFYSKLQNEYGDVEDWYFLPIFQHGRKSFHSPQPFCYVNLSAA